MVGVSVEHRVHRIPRQRLLQTAGTQERINLLRLAFHRALDRRIVQERHPPLGAEAASAVSSFSASVTPPARTA